MNNIIGIKDNIFSVNTKSTVHKIKSFRMSNDVNFNNIIKYRIISEYLRNGEFLNLLNDSELDKINSYLFKLRFNDDLIICNDLGDESIFIGGVFTGSDSEIMSELEKIRKTMDEMVDYQPFNYREIFLNAYNYGNRY